MQYFCVINCRLKCCGVVSFVIYVFGGEMIVFVVVQSNVSNNLVFSHLCDRPQ